MGRTHGFTLIELSIVIVIIGLVIGGVLVGRDLIKAAEIRAQISQIEEFKTAVNTFKVKYGYLPGDMPPSQASQLGFFTFTGVKAGQGCINGANGAAFGNNDGIINTWNEVNPFWSHLSDSKLIKGSYGGTAGNLLIAAAPTCTSYTSGTPSTLDPWDGVNDDSELAQLIPRARIASAGVFVSILGNYYKAPSTASVEYRNSGKANMFIVYNPSAGYTASPSQIYQIDSKIDDGLPTSGNLMYNQSAGNGIAAPIDRPPCTTSGISPIQYDLSSANANTVSCTRFDFLF